MILARWRYGHKSYPVDALQSAALTTEAKTNAGRCIAYPNAIILEDTNSPVRRLPKMRGSSETSMYCDTMDLVGKVRGQGLAHDHGLVPVHGLVLEISAWLSL